MNKLPLLLLTLGLMRVADLPSAASSPAAGQLLNVKGSVEIQRPHQPILKATLLFQLQTGDLLVVRVRGAAEVVIFKNGARYALTEGSAARVEPLGLQRRSGAAPQPLKGLSMIFVKRMSTRYKPVSPRILGVLVRGSSDDSTLGLRLPTPMGTVRDPAPTLRWTGPIEGDQLRVRISDGEHTIVRATLPRDAREFKISPGALKPGLDYVWSVTAMMAGERDRECRAPLRVLPPDQRAELEAMEREAADVRRHDPDNPSSALLMAQIYERMGLVDDARAAYQGVHELRPEDAVVRAALQRLATHP